MKQSKWVSNCLKKTRKVFVLFLVSFLMTAFFSHSAFAASDISISSSGIVSIDDIQPSSTGTLAAGEDNLSIDTTCTEGVNVYASSTNDNSNNSTGTSLVNLTAKAKDSEGTNAASYTINTSSATIGSAAALADNTWGLNTNASEAGNGLYYGLPAFSDSTTPTAIYTGVAASIPVYFGIRVTNTLIPGTYTGQVLYTATVNTACLNYTVAFNKNSTSATGSMESQTILPAGGSLRANSFEYPGYTFLGWSTNPAGKTGTATNGIGTAADVEYGNTAIFPDSTISPSTKPGDSVTLYAIWKKNLPSMQDWATTEFGCSKLQPNEIVTLVDSRDNHEYKVKKLPDGKCWMIQNLTLSATDLVTEGKALTSANTNIPSSDTNSYYVPPKNTRYATANSITNSNVATASTAVNFGTSYSNHPQVAYKAKGDTNHDTGNALPEDTAYYNFYTATLGYSYSGDGKTSGSSAMDICPKGWRLPKVSDNGTSITAASSEFANLARSYNSSASWANANTSASYYTSDATIRQNMIKGDASSLDPELDTNGSAGFTYAGYYGSATLYNVGAGGYYWSSSVYNSNYGYLLAFDTSYVFPQYYDYKYFGFAVRCVAQYSDVSGYMQDFDTNDLASGESTTLVDARDGNRYAVKKFGSGADAEVWMTSNLTLGYDQAASTPKGLALTNADTNIPADDTTTYYLPPAGYMGSTSSSSTTTSTTTVNFNTDNETYAKVQYSSSTGYYNFNAASLGYSGYQQGATSGDTPRDICPKGWQLPRGSSTATYSFYWLDKALGGTGANRTGDTTTRDRYISDFALPYSGHYVNSLLRDSGAGGYWWSSTVGDTDLSYSLYINSSGNVYPQTNGTKYTGDAVRCVSKS